MTREDTIMRAALRKNRCMIRLRRCRSGFCAVVESSGRPESDKWLLPEPDSELLLKCEGVLVDCSSLGLFVLEGFVCGLLAADALRGAGRGC